MKMRILASLATIPVAYLLGAFVGAEIDFREWSAEGRLLVAFMFVFLPAMTFTYPAGY